MEFLSFSATLTQYPEDGPPRISSGPWLVTIPAGPLAQASVDLGPFEGQSAYMVRLRLHDISPARPGWLAATAVLEQWNGSMLSELLPVTWYARPSVAGTHIYFPAMQHCPQAWSLCLRLHKGGL